MPTRSAPAENAKKVWTRPVVQKLSATEALVRIMQSNQPAARKIEQIELLALAFPSAP
jgi:hypothetical protein